MIVAKTPLTPNGDNFLFILFTNLHLENCNVALFYFVSSLFCLFLEQLTPTPAQQKTDTKGQATFGHLTVSAAK